MLRIIANLLFLATAVLSALVLYGGWNESSDGVSIGAITLAGSVLALALMQGQEKQERLLERILAELQRQGRTASPSSWSASGLPPSSHGSSTPVASGPAG